MEGKAITVTALQRMKKEGARITALTAYDALFASILDEAGVDMILVGDSLGNVFQGRDTTLPVTIENMIYHGEIVARTVKHAIVIVDMPFMSFQADAAEAVRNAGRIMKETGCKGVKLEGGVTMGTTMRRIVDAGIPVLGHVGLTPQSVHKFGGFGVRGRNNPESLIDDARAVEDSGAFAVVLEKMPRGLGKEITASLTIPTIGIGAGPDCDCQILVTPDVLGLFTRFKPAFVRRYAQLADEALKGVKGYIDDVRSGEFPSEGESYD